jgi:predicted DNA-binding protein
MNSPVYRVRLDHRTVEELQAFASHWQRPLSSMIRDCCELVLANRDLYPAYRASRELAQHAQLAAFLEALAMNQAPEVPAL